MIIFPVNRCLQVVAVFYIINDQDSLILLEWNYSGGNISVVRGAIARRRFEVLRERHCAAIVIQKYVRMQAACRQYQSAKEKIVKVQAGNIPFNHIYLIFLRSDQLLCGCTSLVCSQL